MQPLEASRKLVLLSAYCMLPMTIPQPCCLPQKAGSAPPIHVAQSCPQHLRTRLHLEVGSLEMSFSYSAAMRVGPRPAGLESAMEETVRRGRKGPWADPGRKEASEEPPCQLDLGLLASRLGENTFPLIKHPPPPSLPLRLWHLLWQPEQTENHPQRWR